MNKRRIPWINRIKRWFNLEPKNKEDVINVLRRAQSQAIIDTETLTMLEGVIIYSQLKARDVMLPKQQITSISAALSLSDIITIITRSGHSRFPVTGAEDDIIGILHAKDLLKFHHQAEDEFDLHDVIRQATFIPESKKLNLLLSDFRHNRNHMAIVVDEYGTHSGFLTLEDIIEQIIGDIADEFDIDEESYIKVHGAGHYMIKAHTPIAEFNEQLDTDFNDELYDTLGGIVLASFGRLPKRGETITIDHFEFKIINADARRIKLLECFDLRPQQAEQ